MKNPTSGDLSVMINGINAAQHSHTFLYRGWEVVSTGNPLAHSILRGYVDEKGNSYPNYHFEDLLEVTNLYKKTTLALCAYRFLHRRCPTPKCRCNG